METETECGPEQSERASILLAKLETEGLLTVTAKKRLQGIMSLSRPPMDKSEEEVLQKWLDNNDQYLDSVTKSGTVLERLCMKQIQTIQQTSP